MLIRKTAKKYPVLEKKILTNSNFDIFVLLELKPGSMSYEPCR